MPTVVIDAHGGLVLRSWQAIPNPATADDHNVVPVVQLERIPQFSRMRTLIRPGPIFGGYVRALSEPLIRAEPMGLQGPSETCRNKATKAVLM